MEGAKWWTRRITPSRCTTKSIRRVSVQRDTYISLTFCNLLHSPEWGERECLSVCPSASLSIFCLILPVQHVNRTIDTWRGWVHFASPSVPSAANSSRIWSHATTDQRMTSNCPWTLAHFGWLIDDKIFDSRSNHRCHICCVSEENPCVRVCVRTTSHALHYPSIRRHLAYLLLLIWLHASTYVCP